MAPAITGIPVTTTNVPMQLNKPKATKKLFRAEAIMILNYIQPSSPIQFW